jgi:hypothetical protein
MPEVEALIEAILRGQLGDEKYDELTKVQKMNVGQGVLDILIPALPVLEEIKAAAWEEGSTARDTYLRDSFLAKGPEAPSKPKNPYKKA